VIANASFGCIASESGAAFTWSLNSHENRLTPWSNDAVCDPPGETIYLRDEDTYETWTPTALPIRDPDAAYAVHHGQGYTRYRHASRGLEGRDDRVRAEGGPGADRAPGRDQPGDQPTPAQRHRVRRVGPGRGAAPPRAARDHRARCAHRRAARAQRLPGEFGGRIAFSDLSGRQTAWTGDRVEFLGRNGHRRIRAGSSRARACRAAPARGSIPVPRLRAPLDVPAHGRGRDHVDARPGRGPRARDVPDRALARADLDAALAEVRASWDVLLGGVEVETPDPRPTSWPIAGCSTRRWPAASGRAPASTRPAARSASATSCRT
jgi:cyclic beta-1,2-glucan synthetase